MSPHEERRSCRPRTKNGAGLGRAIWAARRRRHPESLNNRTGPPTEELTGGATSRHSQIDEAPLSYAPPTHLGNILRTLATPEPIKDWSMTSLKEKLIKIGAKVVSHGRYVAFQMAEVAIPRNLFADILRLIAEWRPPPPTLTA
jgi:hypothetical protein